MKWILLLSLSVLSGCGYQFGQGALPARYQTVMVPYIEGDKTGEMTSALVRAISRSGGFEYRTNCAQLILKVSVLELYDENIGYCYDLNKKGKLTHAIIPNETRITVLAEVTVKDSTSGCAVLGPARIYASVDFDHAYYFVRDGENIFSLGQVNDYDEAYDAVMRPLGEVLADKIVDFVVYSW